MAAKMGWPDNVRRLLMEESVDINAIDFWGRSPLIFAADNGHHSVVEELLKHSAININIREMFRGTALSIAAEKGHARIVTSLLKKSDIDVDTKDADGRTALARAANAGKEEVMNLLLAKVDIDTDHVDRQGRTALMLTSIKGHVMIMKRLLEHGAAPEKQDINGRTALNLAVNVGCLEGVELLSSGAYRGNLEIQDNFGYTALQLASNATSWSGGQREEIVAILLANGADPHAKPVSGMTAETVAVTNSKFAVMKVAKALQRKKVVD